MRVRRCAGNQRRLSRATGLAGMLGSRSAVKFQMARSTAIVRFAAAWPL
jgi:hypothetical protein